MATEARLFLNTFSPLATTPLGREAIEKYGLPPFIDGSIRREPDFQHKHPAITCLCRAGKFVPRLRVGDHVAYMTRKRNYGDGQHVRRLIAVLRVDEVLPDHEALAAWYRSRGLGLPSNCMVPSNPHQPLDRSHRETPHTGCSDGECAEAWNAEYEDRASEHKVVVVCTPLYRCLNWNAPVVHDDVLHEVFGEVPGTQNPGALDLSLLPKLLRRLKIDAPPSSP